MKRSADRWFTLNQIMGWLNVATSLICLFGIYMIFNDGYARPGEGQLEFARVAAYVALAVVNTQLVRAPPKSSVSVLLVLSSAIQIALSYGDFKVMPLLCTVTSAIRLYSGGGKWPTPEADVNHDDV